MRRAPRPDSPRPPVATCSPSRTCPSGGFTTALDAIQALRGNWLETHGTNSFFSPTTIKVYLDDAQVGGVDELSSIAISEVVYIRHYDGIAATARWGLDHGAGAIYVSTHPGLQPI